MLGAQWAVSFLKGKGNGGGNGKAVSVEIAEIKKDIGNLQSLKDMVDSTSKQMYEFAKDHAEFVGTYAEKHAQLAQFLSDKIAQLSERLARLEAEK